MYLTLTSLNVQHAENIRQKMKLYCHVTSFLMCYFAYEQFLRKLIQFEFDIHRAVPRNLFL